MLVRFVNDGKLGYVLCVSSDMMAICEMLRLNGVGSGRVGPGGVGSVLSVSQCMSCQSVCQSVSIR